jgi:hypothetical protein
MRVEEIALLDSLRCTGSDSSRKVFCKVLCKLHFDVFRSSERQDKMKARLIERSVTSDVDLRIRNGESNFRYAGLFFNHARQKSACSRNAVSVEFCRDGAGKR